MTPNDLHLAKIQHSEAGRYIWNRLISAGLSPMIAAGIMGNMWEESKFNPEAVSKGGTYKGLVQLSPSLYKFYTNYLTKNGKTAGLESQMDYLIPILTERNNHNPHGLEGQHIYRNEWGGSGRQDKFLNGNYATPGDAARAFATIFERNGANTNDKRANYAQMVYDTYNTPEPESEEEKPFFGLQKLTGLPVGLSIHGPLVSPRKEIGILKRR